MLDQKRFGEKLHNHRKRLGMTQEEVAEKVMVSPQAVSKWEAGDCLPDCFNLKAISDVYQISTDVLLETESDGDIDTVARKIEQLGTEFVWAAASGKRYGNGKNLHKELGEDLWQMWKGLYFAETGDRTIQEEDKRQGNLHIAGSFGQKIWDDEGVACVIKSSLIQKLAPFDSATTELIAALCSEDGQKLIISLSTDCPMSRQEILEKTGIEPARLNELLLLFTESRILAEFVGGRPGYLVGANRGIAAYMILAAMYILNKKGYTVSQYITY